jgi:hypothetical protein
MKGHATMTVQRKPLLERNEKSNGIYRQKLSDVGCAMGPTTPLIFYDCCCICK